MDDDADFSPMVPSSVGRRLFAAEFEDQRARRRERERDEWLARHRNIHPSPKYRPNEDGEILTYETHARIDVVLAIGEIVSDKDPNTRDDGTKCQQKGDEEKNARTYEGR